MRNVREKHDFMPISNFHVSPNLLLSSGNLYFVLYSCKQGGVSSYFSHINLVMDHFRMR